MDSLKRDMEIASFVEIMVCNISNFFFLLFYASLFIFYFLRSSVSQHFQEPGQVEAEVEVDSQNHHTRRML